MSIANQISRIKQLRNTMASKLWELRITEDTDTDTSTLTLQECKDVIDTMGGTLLLDTTDTTNVAKYKYVQVNDPNLTADNIKKDVSILGVLGTYDNSTPVIQLDSTLNIVYGLREPPEDIYNPATGKNGFPAITFAKPADGCTNMTLRPENIKKDVSILGIRGTYCYNTMNFAYSDGFNPEAEGNVGISNDGKIITWALYDLNNNYIHSTNIATDNIQAGRIIPNYSFFNLATLGYFIISAKFGVHRYFDYDYNKFIYSKFMYIDVVHKTIPAIGEDKIYRLEVVGNNLYEIIYQIDNNNHYRAYLRLNLNTAFFNFYDLPWPFKLGTSDNLIGFDNTMSYHVEIRW